MTHFITQAYYEPLLNSSKLLNAFKSMKKNLKIVIKCLKLSKLNINYQTI